MFTAVEVARRIERAEARFMSEIAKRVAVVRPAARALVEEIAGGVAVFCGPQSPMNKMIGAGFDGAVAEAELERVERAFADRGEPIRAEVSTLADPAFHLLLSGRGYLLHGFENVLGRPIDEADRELPEESSVVEVLADDAIAHWSEMLVTGFGHPDVEGVVAEELPPRESLEQIFDDISSVPGLHRYVARVEGAMAAGATMRIDDGIAQFCGSATLPAFRRRGLQSAFLRRRLADAARLGCDLAVVTTAPGSKSQENVQGQGFSLLYSRAVLVWQGR